ncbi:mechanosensitive channel MscK [Aliidiomarina minuta]|uniref:Mechanosensitive channel MscK n=2 Tax=Aliidiomarina minuta TaxID=880057 RepID=A0A432W7X4_9GAMM|nr:mechanosensitive channel MscK [Aliidiomarina minuta]
MLARWLGYLTVIFTLTLPGLALSADSDLAQRLQNLQQLHTELAQDRADLSEEYRVLAGNQLLHQVLQEQRSQLPQLETEDVSQRLAELRLNYFQLQREQRQPGLSLQQRQQLQQEQQELGEIIEQLVELTRAQYLLAADIAAFQQQLDEYLFWTPSNPPMNADWWRQFPQRALQQTQRISSEITTIPASISLTLTPISLLLALLLILLIARRRRIKALITLYDTRIKKSDDPPPPWIIPAGLALNALLVLPFSLSLLLLGEFISHREAAGINLGAGFTAVALAWFMVAFLRKLVKPSGFAELYFNWSTERCDILRRYLTYLAYGLLPTSFVLAFTTQQELQISTDVLGMLILSLASVYLIGTTIYLLRALPPMYHSTFWHRLIGLALLLLPISLLFILTSGYYYTALKLSGYYLATFYIVILWLITEASVERWMQFSYERMRRDISDASTDEPATLELIEESQTQNSSQQAEIDPDKAQQQSQRLAHFALLIAFSFILYAIWSEATVALEYLDTQFLWQNMDDGESALSIGNLLSAFFIALVGYLLARNLPGLLEMLFLSRLKLEVGTSYAVTSLLNYVVVSVAIILFLGTLGVSWNQLQWLAAGLTVGLGFGLQEIFANFISGLIIFFERPLRVGDIITLDNLSGRVAKIRIRATVITDFDRRDIIVPNRNFITGKFVNWSLSNTVTRLIIKVGVAYGSDLQKTQEILLDIAQQEEMILDDPPPQALFLSFGESTLDHELRVHVGHLKDRNPTIDAVNREIDRRFREAGIEIAFNQVDIHFRNALGLEQLVEQRKA